MCRCPAPSAWLACELSSRTLGRRLGWPGQSVRDLHVCHANFVEGILQEIFFGRSEVALGLFRQQAECIDGLSCANDIEARLATLLVHETELKHRRHV